ncbi:sigma-B regulation protein RsbU (phosphoserine phosphatase) [Cyclobacterium xiamenense]|uniref:Sigma-B regulation protein RsbU (Phosphoserine phosphatase) n=1 Tax=Cyclobacterium xiamenense TaxID=1297121 RepID=A0A1H6Z4S4_9BACT|nr:PP2C family protein-serine/threonine phosphatase [Cyclobacterium xiamenense]SEJ48563.1 sigma-B regulation protein RsbU (phosphoserine phosphatase) [Cyclobacterium xiamenense]
MTTETLKYQRKELELKALLEITQAINENKTENVLLNIFKFTCLVHLNIKSLLLYVFNEQEQFFERRISHQVKGKLPEHIAKADVEENKDLGKLSVSLSQEYSFSEVNIYVPVYHKEKMLAILFLNTKDKEKGLDLDFTQALTNILVVALENKRFARKQLEQERLRKEMEIASSVQRMLFPASLPSNHRLKAKVTYFPHSTVGGDYYDLVQPTKNDVYFCVADVSGKGMPASLLMSNFQAALRTLLRSGSDLVTIVEQLNSTIFENTNGERFITFFLGHYRYSDGRLRYVNAGHNPPVLCTEQGQQMEVLEAGTTILGAFESLPFLEQGQRNDLHGFIIHLYTDGLTETLNPREQEYGEESFLQYIRANPCATPEHFHLGFFTELDAFSEGVPRRDDLTLLSLQFNGDAPL